MIDNLAKNGKLLIYRSSAGSGKTFTLVLNYLCIILASENPFKFKEVLAITFTNKAASEMKARVFEHLIELSDNKKGSKIMEVYAKELDLDKSIISSNAKNRLSSMLHNYTDVSILTIDKFAHRLIRSFSRDLNLEADFEIEMDFKKVLAECIDQLIDQVGTREDLTKLVVHHAKDKTKFDKSWKAVEDFKNFGALIAKEDTAKQIEEIGKFSIDDLFQAHQKAIADVNKASKEISDLASPIIKAIESFGVEHIKYKSGGWSSFFSKALNGKYADLLSQAHARLYTAIESETWVNKGAPIEAYELENYFSETVEKSTKAILANCSAIQKSQIIREQIIGLGLLKEISIILEQYKKSNNLVLISDFNKTISDIVLNQPTPFIYERIGCKFNHYFIDEFQDTSVQQWQNFIPLVDDSLAKGKTNLIVGDSKQAIYRFRNGEAKQFIDLPEIYQKNDSVVLQEAQRTFDTEYNPRFLDDNYRSASSIVNFNNRLFEYARQQMPEEIAAHYNRQSQTPIKTFAGRIEISLHSLKKGQAEEKRFFENQQTLKSIQDCISDGFNYADITILVAKNKIGQEIAEFLLSEEIPVTSSDSLKILNNKKILVILALLNVLENTHSQDDVIRIISNFFPDQITSLAQKLELRTTKDNGKQKLLEIIQKELQINLLDWQSDSLYTKSKHIISRFFKREEQDQFVESFLENTHSFSSSKGEDISLFLEWLLEKNPAIDASENENAVQVMSIHKAKGLEFPIVIIHRCDWELGPTKFSRVWTNVSNSNMSLNVQLYPSEKNFAGIDKIEELDEANQRLFLDALNLFYVAATRPVHRLYINATNNTDKDISALIKNFLEIDPKSEFPIYWNEGERVAAPTQVAAKRPHDFTYETNSELNIEIATRARKDQEGLSEQRWGQLVHTALELIKNTKEIQSFVNDLIVLGKISENEKEQFEADLLNTFNHEQLKQWLNVGHTELREQEIIDELGGIYIPDRIILLENETILIDFKTGQPRTKDEHQITDYGHLLTDLGYSNIKKYLFYVRKSELKQVLTL
ncbi:MAG: ATP-dependent exoDNAse (exonuclease V) beta subunit [Parvicellaceae bacterium]|jgi:ATP-dependent exoDNAse (exonuclease V) beta subunit